MAAINLTGKQAQVVLDALAAVDGPSAAAAAVRKQLWPIAHLAKYGSWRAMGLADARASLIRAGQVPSDGLSEYHAGWATGRKHH